MGFYTPFIFIRTWINCYLNPSYMRSRQFIFIFLPFLFLSCKQKSKSLFTLLDNNSTNIHFKNINAENEQINILTYEYLYNGGGVAIGDINNDGLKDIYFTSNNLENK